MKNFAEEIIDHLQIRALIVQEELDEMKDPDYQQYCEMRRERRKI